MLSVLELRTAFQQLPEAIGHAAELPIKWGEGGRGAKPKSALRSVCLAVLQTDRRLPSLTPAQTSAGSSSTAAETRGLVCPR